VAPPAKAPTSCSAATPPTWRTATHAGARVAAVAAPLGRTAAGKIPVSDEKIGLDYKITRMLQGSVLDPVEAHFFGTARFRRFAAAASELERAPRMQAGDPLELPQSPVSPGKRHRLSEPLPVAGPVVLSAGHILYKVRPYEHGALAGGAHAVSGSPQSSNLAARLPKA